MPELVALDLPGGNGFVDALRAVWDTGDAVAPLDPRLPAPATRALLSALRPTKVVGSDGEIINLHGGAGVEVGDALVMATSGTTGEPRGVVLTHDALKASALATSARLGIEAKRHAWLACLPLAHIGGMSVVTRALLSETPLVLLPSFDAKEVNEMGRSGRTSHVSLVMTALARIDAALFTTILLGGSAPRGELAGNVVTTYGLTETGSGVVYDGLALDGVEVAIGDGNSEARVGEILVRAPMLLRIYRDGLDPRLVGPDGSGGWFPTGDGGRLVDGVLVVDGRLDEVINTGGEKVYPNAVERVLGALVDVVEVAVWKRPDPEWGERVVAWVVPVDRAHPPDLDGLREAARQELPAWAMPKELVVVEELPRTSSGKVLRRSLS